MSLSNAVSRSVVAVEHVCLPCRPSISPRCAAAAAQACHSAAPRQRRHSRRTICCVAANDEVLGQADGQDEYMQEYQDLKSQLLDTTRKAGGALAAYLLLTADGESALAALVGSGASYIYLLWMYRDVDNVKPTDIVPMRLAEEVEPAPLRWAAKWMAAYRHALNPRLLILVVLAAAVGSYGKLTGEPVALNYIACMLGGFLSYKVALLFKLGEGLVPKGYGEESSRPTVERIEDELDKWGRPKVRTPLPTAALPEGVDTKDMERELAQRFDNDGQGDVRR